MNEVGLPDEVRALLVSVATPVEVLAGEDVAEQGVEGSIGVVSAGRFAVMVTAEGARSRTIALVQEGDALVMPTDAWQGAPGARVVAATDSEMMMVTGSIDELVAVDSAAGAWLVRALAQAVADRELSAAIALEPRLERRLILKLRQLADRWGRVTPEGVRLDLRVTHQELADMVGAARESVTVAFGRLQDQGEIELRRRTVIIRHMDDQGRTATEIA
jgi:CRP-like cAMP-binding protein